MYNLPETAYGNQQIYPKSDTFTQWFYVFVLINYHDPFVNEISI